MVTTTRSAKESNQITASNTKLSEEAKLRKSCSYGAERKVCLEWYYKMGTTNGGSVIDIESKSLLNTYLYSQYWLHK